MSGEGNGAFDIKFPISWLFAAGILYSSPMIKIISSEMKMGSYILLTTRQ